RAADVMLALPALVLILAVRVTFPPGLPPGSAIKLLLTILVALGWAEMARLARGLTRELREREYVVAAVSLGCSTARIIVRHILRNAALPLATLALLILPAFLLAETALSFLGVGLQEPEASWGTLLIAVDSTLFRRGHALAELSPALAITLFVLGVPLLGDGVEKPRREIEGYQEYVDHGEDEGERSLIILAPAWCGCMRCGPPVARRCVAKRCRASRPSSRCRTLFRPRDANGFRAGRVACPACGPRESCSPRPTTPRPRE